MVGFVGEDGMAIATPPDGPVQMDPAVMSAVRTPDDVALRTAWQRYLEYSTAANKRKRTQERARLIIIVLSVVVTVLAVFSTVLATESSRLEVLAANPGISADVRTEALDGWCAGLFQSNVNDCLNGVNTLIGANKIVLIALPLIIAGMLTWMMQFMPSTAWIGYRVGAELVRYQIYLYRMESGDFLGKGPNEQQEILLDRVKQARRRVDQLGSSEPYTLPTPPNLPAAVKATCDDERDDGFSPLTVDEYLLYRIRPQREWYVSRLHRNYRDLKNWRAGALVLTGLGAFLVAVGFEPWVAVTTAIATAVGIFIDLRMYGRTYAIYHTAVMELDEEVANWLALSQERKDTPLELSDFVKRVEDILQRERERWMQQAMQSQTASEQGLLRNVNLANSPFKVAEDINSDYAVTGTAAGEAAASQAVRATSTRPALTTAQVAAAAPAAAVRPAIPATSSRPAAAAPSAPRPVAPASAPAASTEPPVLPMSAANPATNATTTTLRPAVLAAARNGSANSTPVSAPEPEPAPAVVGRAPAAPTRPTPPTLPPELDVLPPSS